jgi:hypothetical protein
MKKNHLALFIRIAGILFFSQKWSFLIKCLGQNSHQSIFKIIFIPSSFIRRDKQAQIFNFWTSTFEKISKILKLFEFFGHFSDLRGRDARPSALKILVSSRIKVAPNECFRPQLLLIFAYFDFAPP